MLPLQSNVAVAPYVSFPRLGDSAFVLGFRIEIRHGPEEHAETKYSTQRAGAECWPRGLDHICSIEKFRYSEMHAGNVTQLEDTL